MHTILMVYYHEIIDCKKVINYHKKVKSYYNNDKLFKNTKEKIQMGNSKERIVQLRLVGFVDVRSIKDVIDSFYESSIVINFTEKETNNSLIYRIVKSFYGEKSEGIEKTTRAEIVFKKKAKGKLSKIFYKYTNVYTSVDDIGDESIDEKMRKNGFTKLTFEINREEDIEEVAEVFKTVASRLNLEGYIINVDVMNNRKEIKWSEYIEPEKFDFPGVV